MILVRLTGFQAALPMALVVLIAAAIQGNATGSAEGAWNAHPELRSAEARTYKSVAGVELKLFLFHPADHKPTDKRPAIVFFFGGGWTTGTPAQFAGQARHFASRGMVAACADYRVKSRHGVAPDACVADAKSAVRWLRSNAASLGVDPDRIAVSGGSAGGHLAASCATVEGFDTPEDDLRTSALPNAMILFNPALDARKIPGDLGFGANAEALSPVLYVRSGMPPTIIFHGREDRLVPVEQAEQFAEAMKRAGNRCELVIEEGAPHGFFNYQGTDPPPPGHPYQTTLEAADRFIVSLGWLEDK